MFWCDLKSDPTIRHFFLVYQILIEDENITVRLDTDIPFGKYAVVYISKYEYDTS